MGNNSPVYIIEGKEYDRITRVLDYFLDPGLVDWKLKVGEKEAKRIGKVATTIGSRVDDIVKGIVVKGRSELKPKDVVEVHTCIEAFQRWQLEHPEIKIIGSDILGRSELLQCAGTLDLLAEDTLIDLKCAGKIGAKYWLQVAMYNYMLPEPKKYLAILRLHKSLGIYEYQVIPYDNSLVEIFIGLLNAYRYFRRFELGGINGADVTDDEIPEEPRLEKPEISYDRAGGNW